MGEFYTIRRIELRTAQAMLRRVTGTGRSGIQRMQRYRYSTMADVAEKTGIPRRELHDYGINSRGIRVQQLMSQLKKNLPPGIRLRKEDKPTPEEVFRIIIGRLAPLKDVTERIRVLSRKEREREGAIKKSWFYDQWLERQEAIRQARNNKGDVKRSPFGQLMVGLGKDRWAKTED